MQLPPYYRLWIYSISGLIIIVQVIFVACSYSAFSHQWIKYFPFGWPNFLIIFTQASVGIQFFVCVGGILGAFLLNRTILRVYWLFMLPLLICDFIKAVAWALQFREMHRQFPVFIERITDEEILGTNGMDACPEWASLQVKLNCCAPQNIRDFCNYTESSLDDVNIVRFGILCMDNKLHPCTNPLLRWFHERTDMLAIMAFFVLFPLKLIVVVVLRKDIQELFVEIVYSGNNANGDNCQGHWTDDGPADGLNSNLLNGLQFSMDTLTCTPMDTITSTTSLMQHPYRFRN